MQFSQLRVYLQFGTAEYLSPTFMTCLAHSYKCNTIYQMLVVTLQLWVLHSYCQWHILLLVMLPWISTSKCFTFVLIDKIYQLTVQYLASEQHNRNCVYREKFLHPGPRLVTEMSSSTVEMKAYINILKRWDVIMHPCLNINGCLARPPLKLRHGWVITYCRNRGGNNLSISVSKRECYIVHC